MKRTVSGMMIILLLVSMLMLLSNVQRVKATGNIYIRADGSVDPSTAPISTIDNVTYTLTGNIISDADGIVVERDNIVLDGTGYAVMGSGGGSGIDLINRNNVTIRNINMENFDVGLARANTTVLKPLFIASWMSTHFISDIRISTISACSPRFKMCVLPIDSQK